MSNRRNIINEFTQLEKIINSDDFLKSRGLSNEVAYYVYEYPIEEEPLVKKESERLIRKYSAGLRNVEIVHIDLYITLIMYLKELNLLEETFDMESKYGFEYLNKSLIDLLEMNLDNNFFVRFIQGKTQNNDNQFILLLTGIGDIYPIVRAHNILNKLHLNYRNVPVILMYPGTFDGQSFILYNKIDDDNYYRAFPLLDELKSLKYIGG